MPSRRGEPGERAVGDPARRLQSRLAGLRAFWRGVARLRGGWRVLRVLRGRGGRFRRDLDGLLDAEGGAEARAVRCRGRGGRDGRGGHLVHPLRLVLVLDAGEAERKARGLDHRLVADHPAGPALPRVCRAVALAHPLRDLDGVRAILAVDDGGAGVRRLVELDAVELRVRVHDLDPSVDADDGDDRAGLGGECVDFLLHGVEAVLGGGHARHLELLVGLARGEDGLLEDAQKGGGVAVELRGEGADDGHALGGRGVGLRRGGREVFVGVGVVHGWISPFWLLVERVRI